MSQLRAFVGHSFTENDKEVVEKFLNYLDTLKESGIVAEWKHARAAQPRDLREKVLELIGGKNVLIAICTRKERVVDDNNLRSAFMRPGVLKGEARSFEWKTSDWIIQEIGLAIGREMSIVVLLEQGVRKPGGLQGDIEYIPFDREVPEKSFVQIQQMLNNLRPLGTVSQPAEVQPAPASGEAEEGTVDDDSRSRDESEWSETDYKLGFILAIKQDATDRAEEIEKAYLAKYDSDENRKGWRVFSEWARLESGKGGTLKRLEELGGEVTGSAEAQYTVATSFKRFGDGERAAEYFRRAAEAAEDGSKKAKYLEEAAIALLEAGKAPELDDVLTELKRIAGERDTVADAAVEALRNISESRDEEEGYIGLAEYLLQLRPEDIDVRFALAYFYSQHDYDHLALFHYLRIPERLRGGGAWNNLGVQYRNAHLEGKSVTAFRRAEEEGETLAMSNLAEKLLDSGFIQEAQEICDRALAIDNYHQNVLAARQRVQQIPKDEAKKERELLETAAPYSEFFRGFGEALVMSDCPNVDGSWQGPGWKLEVRVTGAEFCATGEYEQMLSLLASLRGQAPESASPRRRRIVYTGVLNGRTVRCRVEDNEVLAATENFSDPFEVARKTREALLVISENGRHIKVYERSGNDEGKLFDLKRVEVSSAKVEATA
jgi:tetratricopeptide (TPR) repeat protein